MRPLPPAEWRPEKSGEMGNILRYHHSLALFKGGVLIQEQVQGGGGGGPQISPRGELTKGKTNLDKELEKELELVGA